MCQRENCNNKDVSSISWNWYKDRFNKWQYDLSMENWINLCEEHINQSINLEKMILGLISQRNKRG